MLKVWEKQAPGRLDNIFASLQNVALSHLADTRLFDFVGLGSAVGSAEPRPNWLVGSKEAN